LRWPENKSPPAFAHLIDAAGRATLGGQEMKRKNVLISVGMLPLSIALASSAAAQDQAKGADAASTNSGTSTPTDNQIQDIVVTAQFRSQRVQDTPIAITALGKDELAAKGLDRITDITDSAPNVVMKPSGSVYGPAATVFIRGVGQTDSSFAADPGVGIYVDDVYRGITFGSMLDLLDLDRVEILRGPQGTLAGKNSIGGAVKLFTAQPEGDGSGYVEATTGSYSRLDFKGAADISLVPDKLFARISGVTRHRDGYLTRLDYNCTHPTGIQAPTSSATGNGCVAGREGGQDYTAGRLALRWIASDKVEVNLAADRLVDDSEPTATKLISLAPPAANTPGFPDRSVFITGPTSYTNYSTYQIQSFTDPANYLGKPGTGTHPAIAFPTNNHIRAWDASATIDVNLDSVQIKSITAYQFTDGRYSTDNDATPFGISGGVFGQKYRQFTQELRLSGSIARAIDWTLGAYYFDGKGYQTGVNFISVGLANETVNGVDDYIPTTSKSVFAHAVWHVTDRLNLTGGIRYTDDKKSYFFRRTNVFLPGQPTYTTASKIDGLTSNYKGDHWDFRANVDYKFAEHVMAYAQFSTGHRGGGVNPRPFVVEQAVPFNPETLSAYEVGLKTDLFDRRVRLNLSAFINNYNNMIFSNTAPTVVNGVVISAVNSTPINAGDGRFKGVEAEVTIQPIDGLSIDGNVSYLDFHLVRLGAAGASLGTITLANIAPYVTKWKAAGGIQYRAGLGDLGSLSPRLDVAYQSSFYTAIDNNPASLTPAYTVANARLTWQSAGGDLQVTAAVTNLFDKFYYLNKFRGPAIASVTGQPAAPRQWSISVKKSF
jgi:iron complex outermembrane receptor protein